MQTLCVYDLTNTIYVLFLIIAIDLDVSTRVNDLKMCFLE